MAEENPSGGAIRKPGLAHRPHEDAESAPRTPSGYTRSKSRRKTLIVIVVLVLMVGGVFLWRYLGSYESTDDAQVDAHLYPVSARISGYVTKVNVDDNQYVQKGDRARRDRSRKTTRSRSQQAKPTSRARKPPRNH